MGSQFDGLFIFELANNHQGSVDHGLRIIDRVAPIARRHGIRAAVKFQYRDLDSFIHPDYKDREDVKHIPRFVSTRLSDGEFMALVDRVRSQGLIPLVTPFDERSVEKCVSQGIPMLKVASCSASDWPLLERIADARKPTIVSTGGMRVYDIDKVVSFLTHRRVGFALMHCVSTYPTANADVQMSLLDKMRRRYPQVPVGYSGHEEPDNLDVVKIAVAKGARLLERHVGVPTDEITLNRYSMNPEQAERWVMAAMTAKEIAGSGEERHVTEEEHTALMSLKRGVFADRRIEEGEVIGRDAVFFAMPCREGQTSSGEFGQYRSNFVASKAYDPGEAIVERSQPDPVGQIRSVVHDAKGMLFEAGVELGREYEIELSHHYGMERFRDTGAVIVNVINREYCKKIIIMLPGQRHPTHRHEKKEETFQLLRGDLEVYLEDEKYDLTPGDTLLVERNTWHRFSTVRGAVFEEVSTTHIRNDSYYQDEDVSRLDPMQRKTLLESW